MKYEKSFIQNLLSEKECLRHLLKFERLLIKWEDLRTIFGWQYAKSTTYKKMLPYIEKTITLPDGTKRKIRVKNEYPFPKNKKPIDGRKQLIWDFYEIVGYLIDTKYIELE
jgi:hypothetical protein